MEHERREKSEHEEEEEEDEVETAGKSRCSPEKHAFLAGFCHSVKIASGLGNVTARTGETAAESFALVSTAS